MKIKHAIVAVALAYLFVSCATSKNVATQTKKATDYATISGSVTAIEKYGHAVSDIAFSDMQKAGYEHGDIVTVTYDNGYSFSAPITANYDVDKGEFLVRTNYANGFVAACINYGKMNEVAKIGVGSKLSINMKEKAGYLAQYEIRSLSRTDKREDYSSDVEFANFRETTVGVIRPKTLFRGSHPTRKGWARAPYVAKLLQEAEVRTIINMSDTNEELASFLNSDNPEYSEYYDGINKSSNVICLGMSVDFTSDEFAKKIVSGLNFAATHNGPYYFHCNEGKDRTGFVGILLASLMGAKKDAMLEDYMKSYENFYGVKKGTKKYDVIAATNFEPMYAFISAGKGPVQGARAYLTKHGMREAEIDALISKLK
ncbi:MAG: tyrosine-protein phosphatase [Treponema sp.]|nr:tyrosine-protein phosphatase [Treponema sp.]